MIYKARKNWEVATHVNHRAKYRPYKQLKYKAITAEYKTKFSWKLTLSIRDYTIFRVVQPTHYQDDIKYGASRGIRCSCMSLISVS